MRICLVSHGFPPLESTGVENYTAALATALVKAGHTVEVFVPRVARELPDLSMRREERNGYGLTWLTTNSPPRDQAERLDLPGVADRFGDFLDRERPQVVHFQHLIKLGMSLVDKAQQRRIPTLYTAHDYYPVCHRFTLMRPDLERCETVGDSELCSRCDLALSYLDRQEGLGDYQLGVLPQQVGEERFAALQGILAGDPQAAGFSREEQSRFVETRAALDLTRSEAYAKLDHVIAPTRFLADALARGGTPADRIQVLTYGAETEALTGLARPTRGPDRPLRFGYLGGLSKHKGVHVLLEAFRSIKDRAQLVVWGSSSDDAYGALIRRSAAIANVELAGPFRRAQLADCLSRVDVVVVPSIWVENYPFVIREAFAAGRPVITSDVGALGESVQDGVDGMLVPPGDAGALAAAMQRLVDQPKLLAKLVGGIQPVKSIDRQVEELIPIYSRLLESAQVSEANELPGSVRALHERYAELSSMPLRDLFRGVLGNLGNVRAALLGEEPATETEGAHDELPVEALLAGSHTQVLLRDLKREKDWLRESISSFEKTENALRERLSWRESELESRANEADWLRHLVEDTKKSLDALTDENNWLRDVVRKNEREMSDIREESSWVHDMLSERKREAAWLRDTLVAYERDIAWHQEKVRVLSENNSHLEEENARLNRTFAEERSRLQEGLSSLDELAHRALAVQKQVFGESMTPILERFADDSGAATLVELSRVVLDGNRRIFELLDELAKRRIEMRAAIDEANRRPAHLIIRRTGLGRRVASWHELNGHETISTEGPAESATEEPGAEQSAPRQGDEESR